ncbi:MAG: SDR family oxidoreductase [Sphingomonadales bacterium]
MTKLTNKIAVVTGGNSGIGLATAQAFIDEGATVVITGRNQEKLDAAIKQLGVGATAIRADVTKLEELDALFAAVKEKFGKIDVLFANAGGAKIAPITDVTEEHFDTTFNTNVKGLYFTIQKALPLLSDGASVILNASIVSTKGLPGLSVYSATKAAVRSFARTLTSELSERGIRVNVISPGPIETPFYGELGVSEEVVNDFGAEIIKQVPQGRFGKAEEIAGAAVFLAGGDSSYITGIELTVDGGLAQV